MVKFDHLIPAGQEGKIALSVHIYPSWAGEKFNKRALVYTNDPNMKKVTLALTGKVEGEKLKKPAPKGPVKPKQEQGQTEQKPAAPSAKAPEKKQTSSN